MYFTCHPFGLRQSIAYRESESTEAAPSHCIRIIVLDKGHIVEEGTFEQLKEKGGLFAEIIKRQEL